MSIAEYENSLESGQPVELYKFVYGSNAGRAYTYTNAEADIVFNGETYTALPLARDKIATKGRAEGREVVITVPMSSAVAELLRVFPPGRVVTVTIRQGHVPNDSDPGTFRAGTQYPVIWTGRVLESRRTANTTVLTCESSEAGMKRVGLRRHYQWACPLVLYGSRCKADKQAARVLSTVTIAGNKITLPAGWNGTFSTGDFLGGLVEWDSVDGREFRTILNVSGDTLTLNAVPTPLADGDSVEVFLGCPHTLEGCRRLHNNAVNYGGQPSIPLKNPVGKNNHT